MGPGTAVDAARVATAGAALRSWGDEIASVVARHVDDLHASRPPSFAEGLQLLRPVSRESVHTAGWELRHAFAWRNDNRCIQRAAFGALSIAERESGSLDTAVGELAARDGMRAAMVVQYSPNFGNARFHAASVSRTHEGEYLVIDHLFADAEDGVMTLDHWMRRTGASAGATTILSPLDAPPWSLRGGGGGPPVSAKPHPVGEWRAFGDHLAASWQESLDYRLPAFQQVQRGH
jgi:hypothetical protein